MKGLFHTIAICVLLGATATAVRADDAKGFRADLIGQVEYAQKQILALENAIPDGKMA